MELFKVRIEFKTVILAENAESAEKQAESIIKESDDPADFVNDILVAGKIGNYND